MTTSPHGYSFEHIDYDVGLMNALHGHLVDAADRIDVMQLVLRNTADNLEGRGRALTVAKTMAGEVAAALTVPASRVERISAVVLAYGRSAETHAGRANALMADVSDAIAALAASEAALTIAQTDLSAWERGDAYGSWRSGEEDPSRATLVRDGVYRDAVDTAETARTLASAALDDAWTAWERAYECWDHAYARAVAGLAGVDDGYTSPGDRAFLTALADADTVAEVAAVWGGLTDAQREHYVGRYSDLIGNLDGIPYEFRIAANVAALQNASKTTWGEPTDTEIRSLLAELRRKGGVPASLNLFDKNQATAAVLYVDGFTYDENALVDPLTGVTNVNVLIGGMMTELNQIGDWGGTSTNMNKFIDRDGGKGATIAWFGYDSPNLATVGSMDQAITGAETLSGFLRGLDAVAPHEAVTTVIGHSYGSTTAFLAVGSAGDNLGVDNLIAIGSAGLTDRALGTDPDARVDYAGTTVYASTSPEDNWATKGRWAPPLANPLTWGTHPIDPGSLDGVVSFDSDGGYAPNRDGSEPTAQHHDADHLLQTPGHGTHDEGDFPIGTTGHPGGYLQEGSESFANIVEIIESGRPLTTAGGYGSDDWWLW